MTKRSSAQLRRDCLAIWQAGVDAVASDRLILENIQVEGDTLRIGEETFDLPNIGRIAVVGAGKAGAGMAEGIEKSLGHNLMAEKKLTGWVNVPADCVKPLGRIKLHPARPAGINEPTAAGVFGSERILQIVQSLEENDLCICLISGGGSALLPAPLPGISLEDKQAVTKHLSSAGANIQQLNTVRKQLSRIKGGGLAQACRAGHLVSLVISDVIGDPLDIIASGPTIADQSAPQDALDILEHFDARRAGISASLFQVLQDSTRQQSTTAPCSQASCRVTHLTIGNNALAVDAAGIEALRRGYSHAMTAAKDLEGPAEDIGRHLIEMALRMKQQPGPDCLITGGEPIVKLVDSELRGLGGRNQQLVLAALTHLLNMESQSPENTCQGIALLSGGTDGEDGPTDATGAILESETIEKMRKHGLDPLDYLRRNDAYHFFDSLGDLIKTGPTHTNVCDIRVVVVDRIETQSP